VQVVQQMLIVRFFKAKRKPPTPFPYGRFSRVFHFLFIIHTESIPADRAGLNLSIR
jgi:hypothetical protein